MIKKRNGILVFAAICVISIVIALLMEFFIHPKDVADETQPTTIETSTTEERKAVSIISPLFGYINEATFEMVEELFAVCEGTQESTEAAKLLMEMIYNRHTNLLTELPIVIFEISDYYDYNAINLDYYYDEAKDFLENFSINDFKLQGEENYRITEDGILFEW